ncbi:MAG: Nramp family divalent metal transporter [Pirellulaceae bacterium]|nr:Nramp family divalent metal transporter [Pirellulaceae bacterium]
MSSPTEPLVSPAIIPPGTLPPLRERDLPPPISLRHMIGPSIILAGLALGSGEFVLWPYITFQSRFVFFWACLLAVLMQYFLNLEIMRWTLATGETAMTGIIRVWRPLAGIFLLLNIIPWMIPAWATGAAQLLGWLAAAPVIGADGKIPSGPYDTWIALGSIVLCGAILTAGPVVYETVEKVQLVLVTFIILIVVGLALWLLAGRPDALAAQAQAVITLGAPEFAPRLDAGLTPIVLLGALAFAGAGGTMNLSQSNYIRDKGYAMGNHVGRITSPLTGKPEPITEVGFHFPHTAENLGRWAAWWRGACVEHLFSFLCTCLVCLVLLTLIAYICTYDATGQRLLDPAKYREMGFVWAQANRLAELIAPSAKWLYLSMGVAILFTTEFGVLDASSRISTDIVKVAWLRENTFWTEGRLYFAFLWGEIALACGLLLLKRYWIDVGAMSLFEFTAAMNGGVMFLYSMALVYINYWRLPAAVRISRWRLAVLVATVLFFGFFSVWAGYDAVRKIVGWNA